MLTCRNRILFIVPFAVLEVTFVIWPSVIGLYYSFTNYNQYGSAAIVYTGMRNYIQVISDNEFQSAVRNIAVFVPITVAVELILGLTVAYILRKPFKGRGIVRVILLVPWLISPVANGVMWRFLFHRKSGLLNFWLALLNLPRLPDLRSPGFAFPAVMAIEIWRRVPLVGFLILPAMLAIPIEQWDLADLEGMSHFARIHHIILPHLLRLLLVVMLLLIGDSLGTFESILVLYGGGPRLDTITPGLYSYWKAFKVYNWAFGSTSAWLITAAVLFVGFCYLLIIQRKDVL